MGDVKCLRRHCFLVAILWHIINPCMSAMVSGSLGLIAHDVPWLCNCYFLTPSELQTDLRAIFRRLGMTCAICNFLSRVDTHGVGQLFWR
jgi:hypothetical protein